mmetsp:Transcript_35106/g.99918  ORF Transcript_35106/g.99918 Transcript_35106/m.99918 type:complete len:212 (+) Transcript_35106:101-736(+)
MAQSAMGAASSTSRRTSQPFIRPSALWRARSPAVIDPGKQSPLAPSRTKPSNFSTLFWQSASSCRISKCIAAMSCVLSVLPMGAPNSSWPPSSILLAKEEICSSASVCEALDSFKAAQSFSWFAATVHNCASCASTRRRNAVGGLKSSSLGTSAGGDEQHPIWCINCFLSAMSTRASTPRSCSCNSPKSCQTRRIALWSQSGASASRSASK